MIIFFTFLTIVVVDTIVDVDEIIIDVDIVIDIVMDAMLITISLMLIRYC